MVRDPFLVLFCGALGGSPVEDLVGAALRECALDTLDEALGTGAYAGALLVADEAAAAELGPRLPTGVRIDVDDAATTHHFGRRLTEIVRRYELERPVYIGCGMPLIKADEFAAVAAALTHAESAVVSNNYFSADLVGFTPANVVEKLELPDNDRILPRLLHQEGGLENLALPRTIANQFDIDTPVELSILAYAGGEGPRLQAWLATQELNTERLTTAARFFTDKDAVVIVAGRVGSDVVQYLQTETACQTRLYSEERGMAAAGRDVSGEARTMLAYHLRAVGCERFFAELANMGNSAFIDTRAIFAHLGLQPSRPDRYLSDLMLPDGISDPWLREFTAAAAAAPIPVVLGGQSLVTSGLQLLSEAAWREEDASEAEYKARGRAAR